MSALAVARPEPEVATERPSARSGPRGLLLALVVVLGVALRCWRVGFNGLSFDESFSAMAARLPFDRLLEFLRTHDTHPPLDYLVRAPLAGAGASDLVLRLPSLAFSVAALVLFAGWMRTRGSAGLIATTLFAVSTFQVFHGGEARMYALLELLGVGAAMLAEAWLGRPRSWQPWLMSALLLVAFLDHASAFLLAAGLVVLAGVRRDRDAWLWRAGVAVATLVWAIAWGSAFVEQAGNDWVAWIPHTTLSGVATAVSAQVTDLEHVAPIVLAAVLLGAWLLWRGDRVLGRTWVALGLVPFVLAALIGLHSSFFIDRTLTLAAWAPPLALGYLGDAAIRRWRSFGVAVVLAALAMVAAASITFLATKRYDTDLAIAHLQRVVQPGDTIVTRPARYGTLADYRIAVRGRPGVKAVRVEGVSDGDAFVVPGARPTGRVWLFTPVTFPTSFAGFGRCAQDDRGTTSAWTDGVTNIRCLARTPAP